MAVNERRHTQKLKGPSFSSSVLNTIYHSIDESNDTKQQYKREVEDIETLRRALMIEKWLEHSSSTTTCSNSSSSTESSSCSLPETVPSASTSNPKPSLLDLQNPKQVKKKTLVDSLGTHMQIESKFTRRRSKLTEESKKMKEPSSPGGKIKHFLNSIFVSRNTAKRFTGHSEESGSMRKSKSMKDAITTPSCSSTVNSKSCLIKNFSARGDYKSKIGVRFCPVNKIILDDEDENAKRCRENDAAKDEDAIIDSFGDAEALSSNFISSQFIKKNMDSLQNVEADDLDDEVRSCGSSDLFELENIYVDVHEECKLQCMEKQFYLN